MFIDVLRARRSVRAYTDRRLSGEQLELLAEAALRSPSSRGRNPWEFVFVTEPEQIARLAASKPSGSAFLAKATLVVVVCARTDVSDVWVEDAAIASLILHLTAADLGLGSCWVQIRRREHDEQQSAGEYVAGVIGLPSGMTVEAMVGVGHPAKTPPGHAAASLDRSKLHLNRHGIAWRQADKDPSASAL